MALADPQVNSRRISYLSKKKKTCPDLLGSNPLPRCSPCRCSRRFAHPMAGAPVRAHIEENSSGASEELPPSADGCRWAKSISCKEHLLQRASSAASRGRRQQHPTPFCTLFLPVLNEEGYLHPTGAVSLLIKVPVVSAACKCDAKLGLGAQRRL